MAAGEVDELGLRLVACTACIGEIAREPLGLRLLRRCVRGHLAQVLLCLRPLVLVALDARGEFLRAPRLGITLATERRDLGVATGTAIRMRAGDARAHGGPGREQARDEAGQAGEDQVDRRKGGHARIRMG